MTAIPKKNRSAAAGHVQNPLENAVGHPLMISHFHANLDMCEHASPAIAMQVWVSVTEAPTLVTVLTQSWGRNSKPR